MANSNRIRQALDKAICLNQITSGKIQLNPEGVYTIRLTSSYNNNGSTINSYIEIHIIYGHISVLKSFSNASNKKYRVRINNNILYYSVDEGVAGVTYAPTVYIEYNLKPVTLTEGSHEAIDAEYEYLFGRTYYLEDTYLANTNNISTNTFSTDVLNTESFVTKAASISVNSQNTISVPHILAQTLGLELINVRDVNATSILTGEIILKNPNDNGGANAQPAWKFTTANGEILIEAGEQE